MRTASDFPHRKVAALCSNICMKEGKPPGYEEVVQVLHGVPEDAKRQFFDNPKGSLGGLTPLEALAQGQLAVVLRIAKAFADW